jgi:hypothetical protein
MPPPASPGVNAAETKSDSSAKGGPSWGWLLLLGLLVYNTFSGLHLGRTPLGIAAPVGQARARRSHYLLVTISWRKYLLVIDSLLLLW